MNWKLFSSCMEPKTQINFVIELEIENEDIGKLKTTACSYEENFHYPVRNLLIFIRIANENIDKNQDFLYICEANLKLDKKMEFESLENEKIIKIKMNEKSQINPLFQGFGQFSIKNLALNESYF